MAKDRNPGTEADFITAIIVANNRLLVEAGSLKGNPEYLRGYTAAVNDFRESLLRYLRDGVPEGSFDDIVINAESGAEIIAFRQDEKPKR